MDLIEDLKENYGFIFDQNRRNTFVYHLTKLAAMYFYDCIKKFELGSKPAEKDIKNIANSLSLEILDNEIRTVWLEEFTGKFRKIFKRKFKNFKFELSVDQIYRDSFLDYCHKLIRTVLGLIDGKYDFLDLQGLERDIAEYLIYRNIFEEDNRFPMAFKGNFRTVLSRIVSLILRTEAHSKNLKITQIRLTNMAIDDLAQKFKVDLINNRINSGGFLNPLYNMEQKEFDENYQKFCSELKSDKIYVESFGQYLILLIRNVHEIISGVKDPSNFSNFELNLAKDLKKFQHFKTNYHKTRVTKKDFDDSSIIKGNNIDPKRDTKNRKAELNLKEEQPFDAQKSELLE